MEHRSSAQEDFLSSCEELEGFLGRLINPEGAARQDDVIRWQFLLRRLLQGLLGTDVLGFPFRLRHIVLRFENSWRWLGFVVARCGLLQLLPLREPPVAVGGGAVIVIAAGAEFPIGRQAVAGELGGRRTMELNSAGAELYKQHRGGELKSADAELYEQRRGIIILINHIGKLGPESLAGAPARCFVS